MDVVVLAGTRPEAVKLAPLAVALASRAGVRPVLVHSGQHPGRVEQALAPFEVPVDVWLDGPPRVAGTQAELVAGLLPALDATLRDLAPAAVVVVQGDTTTGLVGALAAFWLDIPVVHLEAGLRTNNLTAPFPEEGTRQVITRIAALHLAPTPLAQRALHAEGVAPAKVVLTGNTVVDAVLAITALDLPAIDPALALLEMELAEAAERLVLVTSHRRESWGEPLDRTLAAVKTIVEVHEDVRVLFPVHPNPAVRAQVIAALDGAERVTVTEPLEYPDLVRALRLAALVLTDSGGIQEEAPTFGTPVLVLRDVTERTEAVDAGCAWLVGTDPARITTVATRLLTGSLRASATPNPYGDGHAADRAASAIEQLLTARQSPERAGHS